METVILISVLALGGAIGGLVGWVLRSGRATRESADRQAEVARLQGQLEQAATTQQLLESARAQFTEAAKLTAAEALQGNNDQFLKLANENLGKTLESASRELQQRHQQFQELVKPLSENYSKLNPQIDLLIEQSNRITSETNRLTTALTDNRQAGHWGEVQLRKVVESAGMASYCDFDEQESLGGPRRVRPDLIVRLPERRAIVIDAKASTLAYMAAQQAEDQESASVIWGRHASALRRQVDDLASRNYGAIVQGSLDFVVMFVPGDQFLAAALKTNPGLVEYAMTKRVAIATPASLIAMLWAVNSGWQQWEFARNVDEIREVGSEMYSRLLIFLKSYGSVQQRLTQTVRAFNDSVRNLEGQVLNSARHMAEMQGVESSTITEPKFVGTTPRVLRSGGENGDEVAADD